MGDNIEKVKLELASGKQLALGRIRVLDIQVHENEILVKFKENQWQSINEKELAEIAAQIEHTEKVTYDHLVKAGYIFCTLYFDTKPLYFHNQRVYAIRMLGDQDQEVSVFDPYEDDGVSQTIPEGLQPQRCKFQVSPTESETGERPLDAEWIDVPLGELENLWFRALS